MYLLILPAGCMPCNDVPFCALFERTLLSYFWLSFFTGALEELQAHVETRSWVLHDRK